MGRVPQYLIIGNGRMAMHFCCYLDQMAITYQRWCRRKNNQNQLEVQLQQATHVVVLINDDALSGFVGQHLLKHPHLTIVHFSGSVILSSAFGVHPLQTFNDIGGYNLDDYQQIPFVIDAPGIELGELLPGLANPYYHIDPDDKTYYHALCVLANNVTTLLWQKFYSEMQGRFNIKQQHLRPFLQATFDHIAADPSKALTGPIARGDVKTLKNDITALDHDAFQPLLQAVAQQFS